MDTSQAHWNLKAKLQWEYLDLDITGQSVVKEKFAISMATLSKLFATSSSSRCLKSLARSVKGLLLSFLERLLSAHLRMLNNGNLKIERPTYFFELSSSYAKKILTILRKINQLRFEKHEPEPQLSS